MPLFTKENAAEMAAKSHAARKLRMSLPIVSQDNSQQSAGPPPDQFALTLAHACNETLELLRRAKKPSEKAQLSRALRDLRETWHMATGKPKPGMTKPLPERPVRREIPRDFVPVALR